MWNLFFIQAAAEFWEGVAGVAKVSGGGAGSSGLWTVHEAGSVPSAHHAFLLITSLKATRVMDGRGGALDELVAERYCLLRSYSLEAPLLKRRSSPLWV